MRPFSEWYLNYNVSTFSPSHFHRISPSFKRFMFSSIPFLLFLFQHHLLKKRNGLTILPEAAASRNAENESVVPPAAPSSALYKTSRSHHSTPHANHCQSRRYMENARGRWRRRAFSTAVQPKHKNSAKLPQMLSCLKSQAVSYSQLYRFAFQLFNFFTRFLKRFPLFERLKTTVVMVVKNVAVTMIALTPISPNLP